MLERTDLLRRADDPPRPAPARDAQTRFRPTAPADTTTCTGRSPPPPGGAGEEPALSGSSGKSRGLGQERDAGLAARPMTSPLSPGEGVAVRVPVVGRPL